MVFVIQKTFSVWFSRYEADIVECKEILLIWNCVDFYRNHFVLYSSKNDSKNAKRKHDYLNIYKILSIADIFWWF
jgi:hypothetical protein